MPTEICFYPIFFKKDVWRYNVTCTSTKIDNVCSHLNDNFKCKTVEHHLSDHKGIFECLQYLVVRTKIL